MTSSAACPGGCQWAGLGWVLLSEAQTAERYLSLGQALGAASVGIVLLLLPLRSGFAVAELLHPGHHTWPVPQTPSE